MKHTSRHTKTGDIAGSRPSIITPIHPRAVEAAWVAETRQL